MSDDKADLMAAQAHVEGAFPEWCIENAKEMAENCNADYWWPFLDRVARQNEVLYGDPFPEKDPHRESRRQQAADRHRVLDNARFRHE